MEYLFMFFRNKVNNIWEMSFDAIYQKTFWQHVASVDHFLYEWGTLWKQTETLSNKIVYSGTKDVSIIFQGQCLINVGGDAVYVSYFPSSVPDIKAT